VVLRVPRGRGSVKLLIAVLILFFLVYPVSAEVISNIGSVSANTLYRISVASSRSDCRDVQFLDSNGNVINPSFTVLHGCGSGVATLSFLFPDSYSRVYVKSQSTEAWITYTAAYYNYAYTVSLSANRLTELRGVSTARSDGNDIQLYTLSGSWITPTYWRPATTSGVGYPVVAYNKAGTYIVVSGRSLAGYSQSSCPVKTTTANQCVYQTHGISAKAQITTCGSGKYFRLHNSGGSYYNFQITYVYDTYGISHPAGSNVLSYPSCWCSGDAMQGTWSSSGISYQVKKCTKDCDGVCCEQDWSQTYTSTAVGITSTVYYTANGFSGTIEAYREVATASAAQSKQILTTTSVTITQLSITRLQNAYRVDFTVSGDNNQYNYTIKYRTSPTTNYTTATTLSGYPGSYSHTIEVADEQIEVLVEAEYSGITLASRSELYDVTPPTVSNIAVTITLTTATVSADLYDNWGLASYEIRINNNLVVSKTTSGQSVTISESVSASYFSEGVNVVIVKATDTKGNSGLSSTENQRVYTITLVMFDPEKNAAWSSSDYTNFTYLMLKNYAENEQIDLKTNNITQIQLYLVSEDSIALEFRYTGYPTTFVNEIEPWVVDLVQDNVVKVCLPPPQTLYQLIAYSTSEKKVGFVDPTTGCVGGAGTTKYAFEQYKAYSVWLKPGIWSSYTVVKGVPTYLVPVNPQTAAAINLDALAAAVSAPQPGFFSASVTCREVSEGLYEVSFVSQKPGGLLLLVKENGVLKFNANATGDKMVVLLNAAELGISSEYFDIEGYVDGTLKARGSCYLGAAGGGSFYLPEWLAVPLALGIILFSFTAVGFFTMFRVMLPFACLAAIYITSATEPTSLVRFVQIISLIMFIVSVFFIVRWRGEKG